MLTLLVLRYIFPRLPAGFVPWRPVLELAAIIVDGLSHHSVALRAIQPRLYGPKPFIGPVPGCEAVIPDAKLDWVVAELLEGPNEFVVVEDDPLCARAIARALRRWGRTTVLSTCNEARSVDIRHSSGLIVDVRLPDGSGLALLEQFLRARPALPSMVLTGFCDESAVHEAYRLGAWYLLKPASSAELQLFGARSAALSRGVERKLGRVIADWAVRFRLTSREVEIVRQAVDGSDHARLGALGNVTLATVKKQSHVLLGKTGMESLQGLVCALLKEALQGTRAVSAHED